MALTERKVFYRLIFSVALCLVSLVTSAVAWGHWEYTLDVCPKENCGCVLFGVDYDGAGFTGGHIEYCQFITFVQIPVFLASSVLVFYYGYRVCIKRPSSVKAARKSNPLLNPRQRSRVRGEVILDSEPPRDLDPPTYRVRVVLVVTSLVVAVLLLSAAVTATFGFYVSCKEYRRQLIRELVLNGNAAQVVGSRMSCLSVFDFLDYLQPDRKDYDAPLQYSRKDRINTGITLLLAKSALFMNFMNWLFITVFEMKRIRTSNDVSYAS